MTLRRTVQPVFPSPNEGYDRTNEAEFRRSMEDYVRQATDIDLLDGFKVVNIEDRGADMTGNTNETALVESILQEAEDAGTAVALFIPPGIVILDEIRLREKNAIIGTGWRSELRQATTSVATDFIALDSIQAEQILLADFKVNGRKANQTTTNHGIRLIASGGTFDFFDNTMVLRNILITDVSGDGLQMDSGNREAYLERIYVNGADGKSFVLNTTDSIFVALTAGGGGGDGFDIDGNNNRFLGCKAFGCNIGFEITGERNAFANCEAQDNDSHGFQLGNGCDDSTFTGLIADSNGVVFGNGIRIAGADRNYIQGQAFNRSGKVTQSRGVEFASTPQDNVVVVSGHSNVSKLIEATAANLATNMLDANGHLHKQQDLGDVSGSVTPDIYLGSVIKYRLTGNLTVNAELYPVCEGQRVTFLFQQDGTGGRTITLNATYNVNWAPALVATNYDCLELQYVGGGWVQVGSAVNV